MYVQTRTSYRLQLVCFMEIGGKLSEAVHVFLVNEEGLIV